MCNGQVLSANVEYLLVLKVECVDAVLIDCVSEYFYYR